MEELRRILDNPQSISDLREMSTLIKSKLETALKTEKDTFVKHISYKKDFIKCPEIKQRLLEFARASVPKDWDPKKPFYLWLGERDYQFGHRPELPVNPIPKDSVVEEVRLQINKELGLKFNSCHITIYLDGSASLGFHQDNEEIIDQSHPIGNVSAGETRNLVFSKSARSNTRLSEDSSSRRSYALEGGSLVLMHPGCQSTLYHGVPEDSSATPGIRGSFSYRCTLPKPKQPAPQPVPLKAPATSTPKNQMEPKTTLIAGDSMIKHLEPSKLMKNGNTCLKTFKGGAKIPAVKTLIEDFAKDHANEKIDQLVISVGANDTRYLKSKDAVKALKPELDGLIKLAKKLFPEAQVFMMSLLPRKLNLKISKEENSITVDKFYEFNRLLYGLCGDNNVKYMNAAPLFFRFKSGGGRSLNMRYFTEDPSDEVHLSTMGTSVLARQFIYVINRHNNTKPTAY